MNFNTKSCFFIAEIGQNHQGDITTAKQLILQAKKIGIDCVKFQKSNLNEKFTTAALKRPYNTVNSFGSTYGEHKEFLEFTIEQFKELQEFSNSIGILFGASAMDTISLDELINLKPSFIKIGSGDANNIPLLENASQCEQLPIIVSTGMQKFSMVQKIAKIMENHNNCALLHCVSSYPVQPEDTNLRRIEEYRKQYPNLTIGYSGHESDILISQVAYLLGAKIIERHFTFDKLAKGSDHCLSLLPYEFKSLISNIYKMSHECEPPVSDTFGIIQILRKFNKISKQNELEIILALKEVFPRDLLKCEMSCYGKLGKTLVYRGGLKKDHVLSRQDIAIKVSEPQGLPAELIDNILGYSLLEDVSKDQPIYKMHLTL